MPRDTGWVKLLRDRLAKERFDYSVANSSISGDTTSGGRARLTAVLTWLKPAIVIVELGGNDALRGVPFATTEDNLRAIVREQAADVSGRSDPSDGAGPAIAIEKRLAKFETLAGCERVPMIEPIVTLQLRPR